jgi:hypothetical protein
VPFVKPFTKQRQRNAAASVRPEFRRGITFDALPRCRLPLTQSNVDFADACH